MEKPKMTTLQQQGIQILQDFKIEGEYIQDDIFYALSLTTVLDEAMRRLEEYGVSTNPEILPTVALLASRYANSAYEKYREWYNKLSSINSFKVDMPKGVDRDEE